MQMDMKNIFVSHVHEDDDLLQNLKELLDRSGYEIRDGSIDSSKPNAAKDEDYIKSQILAPRIRWASALVVLVTPNTHESTYVDWEIEYAQKEGKRIVGVWAHGGQRSDLPDNLNKYGDAVVGWQADRIMDAISGKINNWFGPEGEDFGERSIPRYNC
jgi:hypothetical protein